MCHGRGEGEPEGTRLAVVGCRRREAGDQINLGDPGILLACIVPCFSFLFFFFQLHQIRLNHSVARQ